MSGSRIRPLLLALLWVWAGCVFLVLDLFLDVPAFNGLRPRSSLYSGMRAAAHRMVGTALEDQGSPSPRVATPDREARIHGLLEELASVRALGRRGDLGGVREAARSGAFPQARMEAVRLLAARWGSEVGPLLAERVLDGWEAECVRAAAARAIASTGTWATDALATLAAADLPPRVRRAVLDAQALAMVAKRRA